MKVDKVIWLISYITFYPLNWPVSLKNSLFAYHKLGDSPPISLTLRLWDGNFIIVNSVVEDDTVEIPVKIGEK